MKIAIIGGGFTGLTSAYYLSKKDHQVVIFEKDGFVGGLASGFKFDQWHLERFYHHIFKTDRAIQDLTEDLGLKNIWLWKEGGAPIFCQDRIYPFSSFLDLLRFSPLSLLNRLRTGLVSLYLLLNPNCHFFENKKAAIWMKKYMGEESWQKIWRPLMKKKFGFLYPDISMTWVWARINRRSRFLGYPKGGFQIIINKLTEEIKERRGKIILNKKINNFKQL
jgi:protoporphyrinogen oxidase